MDEQLIYFVTGVVALTWIVLWSLGRSPWPKIERWMRTNRFLTGIIASIVMIVWGSGIWCLVISKKQYSNTVAMIAATLLVCAGTYFLVRQLLRRT